MTQALIANQELPLMPQRKTKGPFNQISPGQLKSNTPKLYYSHPNGEIWVGDAIKWLRKLETSSVDLVFADPPYNIKKAEWDTFESQQEYLKWSLKWIKEAARILKPNGSLYICGFSEILSDLKLPASRFFAGCRWLVWHYKNKANPGSGTTSVVSEQLKRKWKGCDNNLEYCTWASNRIELVQDRSVEQWIKLDLENEKRRKSIR
jgi:DNA modification methylase